MGRHSAPDDDAAGVVESPSAPSAAPSAVAVRSGRHARTDESAVAEAAATEAVATEAVRPEVVDVPVTAAGDLATVPTAFDETTDADAAAVSAQARATEAEPEPEPEREPKQRRESATRADLRMLREQPALRARCAAAAVVPFVLYAIVLIVIGAMSAFLLWVWIPTITAGAAVGGLLDAAHRRSERT